MKSLEGKRVTVMGLGLHGGALGTIEWLREQRALITVTDTASVEELRPSLEKLPQDPSITYVLGEHRLADFVHADLIIRNPAASLDSPYLQAAQQAHVPIEMDSSLFFQYCRSRHIIGVTGSAGKSTASHAIAHLLQLVYPHTVTIGIDGASPLGALPTIARNSLVVFELSNLRLDAMGQQNISPPTAVVTALYREHEDHYASYDHYLETKKTIIRHQTKTDRTILNADDPWLKTWERDIPGQAWWCTLDDALPAGTQGIFVRRQRIMVRLGMRTSPLFPLDTIPLSSDHERRNVLPAILLAYLANVPAASIAAQLKHLHGLAHRLQLVRTVTGVMYVDDSAATMPEATIAALKSMHGKQVVHILGGSDRSLRFNVLASATTYTNIRAFIFLPGSATASLVRQIKGEYRSPPPLFETASMAEAVTTARQLAQPGDIVLLSPAAAATGLFQDEFDRGKQFQEAVQNVLEKVPS